MPGPLLCLPEIDSPPPPENRCAPHALVNPLQAWFSLLLSMHVVTHANNYDDYYYYYYYYHDYYYYYYY